MNQRSSIPPWGVRHQIPLTVTNADPIDLQRHLPEQLRGLVLNRAQLQSYRFCRATGEALVGDFPSHMASFSKPKDGATETTYTFVGGAALSAGMAVDLSAEFHLFLDPATLQLTQNILIHENGQSHPLTQSPWVKYPVELSIDLRFDRPN